MIFPFSSSRIIDFCKRTPVAFGLRTAETECKHDEHSCIDKNQRPKAISYWTRFVHFKHILSNCFQNTFFLYSHESEFSRFNHPPYCLFKRCSKMTKASLEWGAVQSGKGCEFLLILLLGVFRHKIWMWKCIFQGITHMLRVNQVENDVVIIAGFDRMMGKVEKLRRENRRWVNETSINLLNEKCLNGVIAWDENR